MTIPELGTIRATHPPIIVLTSNRTRDLHDAVKRRCLYQWIDYPSPAARGRDHPPPGRGRLGDARGSGRRRRRADARLRRPEATGDRRGDRLAGRADELGISSARRAARSSARSARCSSTARIRSVVRAAGPGDARWPRRLDFRVETIELDLPALAGAFSGRLRDAGLPVSVERAGRFADALALARPVARRRLYWTARAVFVSDRSQVRPFDAVFREVFGGGRAPPRRRPRRTSIDREPLRPTTGTPTPGSAEVAGDAAVPGLDVAPPATTARPRLPEMPVALAPERRGGPARPSASTRCPPTSSPALRADEPNGGGDAAAAHAARRAPPPRRADRPAANAAGQPPDGRRSRRLAPPAPADRAPADRAAVRHLGLDGALRARVPPVPHLRAGAGPRAEAFVFATRLTRLTRALALPQPRARDRRTPRRPRRTGRAAPGSATR